MEYSQETALNFIKKRNAKLFRKFAVFCLPNLKYSAH